jgi:hypothetical protein
MRKRPGLRFYVCKGGKGSQIGWMGPSRPLVRGSEVNKEDCMSTSWRSSTIRVVLFTEYLV